MAGAATDGDVLGTEGFGHRTELVWDSSACVGTAWDGVGRRQGQ